MDYFYAYECPIFSNTTFWKDNPFCIKLPLHLYQTLFVYICMDLYIGVLYFLNLLCILIVAQIPHCLCYFGCCLVTKRLFSTMVIQFSSVQFVTQSCLTLCDSMDCSMPGLPVHHQLSESTQTHVQWVSDAIQLSHSLSSPSPPAFNLSQHQGLFKWVRSSHQVLGFQFHHQSFQWIFRTDFL